ncbi:hypothetical protein Zmor_009206 [Zophobas morio]|uniref:4-nitrophenylphosphatase n=1 Tax=Zophobas morio TaxID=2755281 RepID=A0AA38MII1_9CUCU|nr:hypothetical protein Zmor_009206 [Zophobas morio]
MRDLTTLNVQELEAFFNSFDTVLSDIDGVLWNVLHSIPGATDAISSLKKINKRVILVTNNTIRTTSTLYKELKDAGFDIEENSLVTPALAMVSYLRKHNITDKKIYVIGMTPLKDLLRQAGFEIVDIPAGRIEESIQTLVALTTVDDEDVGVVIADADVNRNYVKLQKAVTFLQRKDVVFLSGATDEKLSLGKGYILLGPGYFLKILEDMTGRKAVALAKPSANLNDYVVDEFKIKDLSRVLFVGDSIAEDMGFAASCGYKKLLVLSGLAKKSALEKWEFPEEYKPDFYVDSLKSVHDLIVRVLETKVTTTKK